MKIIEKFPPNYQDIKEALPIPETAIFTYGDTIYNPNKRPINSHVLVHEALHTKQQGDDPKYWWHKYINDADFRYSQELEAYRLQYAYVCTIVKDRNELHRFAIEFAKNLSNAMYGNKMTYSEALDQIRG